MSILIVRRGLQGNRGLTGNAAPASITVANNITNVNLVGESIEDVNTVAEDIENVNFVAGNIENIELVGESIADVNTVADNIADVNYVADNVGAITAAATSIASATFYYGTVSGSANAFVVTTGNSVTLTAGQAFRFIANHLTTGNVTVNIDGNGAKALLIDGVDQVPIYGIKNGQVITALYDGTNLQPLHMGPTTGDIMMWGSTTTKAGWLPLNGVTTGTNSIAKTSGGTFNGNVYEGLWKFLYDNTTDTEAPVASGRTTRDADWTANKALTIPSADDMSPYGIGTLVNGGFKQAGATTVTPTGSIGTTGSTSISEAQMPSHYHTVVQDGAGSSNSYVGKGGGGGTNPIYNTSSTGGNNGHTHTGGTLTVNNHTIVHPVFGVKYLIKI